MQKYKMDFKYNSLQLKYKKQCPLCLYKIKAPFYVLECKHTYHMECLHEWFSRPRTNFECPICEIHSPVKNVIEIQKKCQIQ